MEKIDFKKLLNKQEIKQFLICATENTCLFVRDHKKLSVSCLSAALVLLLLLAINANRPMAELTLEGNDSIQFSVLPIAATSSQKSVISVPSGIVKANPFVPYRNLEGKNAGADVPEFSLVEPPETINENSDAARVMDTIVSGILYDKYSPSAILNIEGNDYLVKKGDVVNNYKVLNIAQNSVTVKLGSNIYKAGIGEILTEGALNHNDVSNLSNKFGGER